VGGRQPLQHYGQPRSPATLLCAVAARRRLIRLAPGKSRSPTLTPCAVGEDYATVGRDLERAARLRCRAWRTPNELRGFRRGPGRDPGARFERRSPSSRSPWAGVRSLSGPVDQKLMGRAPSAATVSDRDPDPISSISPKRAPLGRGDRTRYGVAASLLTSGDPIVRDGPQPVVIATVRQRYRSTDFDAPSRLRRFLRCLCHVYDDSPLLGGTGQVTHLRPGRRETPLIFLLCLQRMAEISAKADVPGSCAGVSVAAWKQRRKTDRTPFATSE